MNHVQQCQPPLTSEHVPWIDHAKGITIVLVVMLYAHEWVTDAADAQSWLRHVVEFAAPFRMPDFFLISGLLLSRTIGRDWRTFLDRKVLHFAYFYVLWLGILVVFESPWTAARHGWGAVGELYLRSLYHPYSMLWFIYLLPVFFVVTKLLLRVPPAVVWVAAAALQVSHIETGVKVFDKFMPYYVFFYTGYVAAPYVFRLAAWLSEKRTLAVALLVIWGLADAWMVSVRAAALPGASLVLGMLGAGAVVVVGSLLARAPLAAPLAYCGRNSLAIYLGFYIPLVVTAKLALSSGWIPDLGAATLIATAAGVIAPLLLRRYVRDSRLSFLFSRPRRLRLRDNEERSARYAPTRIAASPEVKT